MNKSKYIWGVIVIIALIFGGYLWYSSYSQKGNSISDQSEKTSQDQNSGDSSDEEGLTAEEQTDLEDADFNAMCENGEWMKVADLSGSVETVSGKLRKVYPDDPEAKEFKDYFFYLEGNSKIAVSGQDLSKLDYFEDREVEVQGVKESNGKSIAISEVRCAGKETDKNLISQRDKLMNYVAKNISSISPQKAPYQKWTVDIIDFVDENNVYVEYYDTVEDDENSDVDADTGRQVLLETAPKSDGTYDVKVLAYWEMGEDDYVLKTGTDKFEDVEDVNSYQYDSEDGTWERID
ncbi:MAG: hypothetical protein WC831_01290 [Parcubacteria group bacterium]|jgi:hypothetical protein